MEKQIDTGNKNMEILIEQETLPTWFQYPPQFLRIVNQNLTNFDPWWILDAKDVKYWLEYLKKSYPSRELFPFARTGACDDFACWEKDKGERVIIIHCFTAPGWEDKKKPFENFWDWLRFVLEETIEYDP